MKYFLTHEKNFEHTKCPTENILDPQITHEATLARWH